MEFVGLSLQATFRSAKAIVTSIKGNSAPAYDGTNLSIFMKDIMQQVSLFCRLAVPTGSKPDVLLVGQEAALRYYEGIEAKGKSGQAIKMVDINPLASFAWLWSEDAAKQVRTWISVAMRAAMTAGANAAVAKGGKGSAGKGGTRRKSTTDSRSLVLACLGEA